MIWIDLKTVPFVINLIWIAEEYSIIRVLLQKWAI